jgi:echinoderm microtubule-associated protein-like 6
MQGHYYGELWGLTVHPNNSTFYTVGEDQLLAHWDSNNKRIIKQIELKSPSKTCHISPNGNFLAVGGLNGKVQIYGSNNLNFISEFYEFLDPDKETITEVKFSPNSDVLAVAYCPPYSSIVFYSTKLWKKINATTKIPARVYNMDFSVDGKFL